MIIDVHNRLAWHDLGKFLKNMDDFHIDKTWLLSWECPQDEYDPRTIKHIPKQALKDRFLSRCLPW